MRLQNTTSCTEKYYAISEQNIFTDLLSLPAVCVSVCLSVSLCVCARVRVVYFSQIALQNVLICQNVLFRSQRRAQIPLAGELESYDSDKGLECSEI